VSENFVRRFSLSTRKTKAKTQARSANGQRVTSSTVRDITLELFRHEFQRTFYVLRDLRVLDLVLRLPYGLTTCMPLHSSARGVFLRYNGWNNIGHSDRGATS
jgi:hypothetical protein